MSASEIRLRRHVDGRVALNLTSYVDLWLVTKAGMWECSGFGDEDVTGEGWAELLVEDLPDPDHHCDTSHDTSVAQWEVSALRDVNGIITAWGHGIEIEGEFHDAEDGRIEELERDALKLLAAIATHRRYATEAGAVTR